MLFIKGTIKWRTEIIIVCCSILFFTIYFVVDSSGVLYQYSPGHSKRVWQRGTLAKLLASYNVGNSKLGDDIDIEATKKVRVLCWVLTHPGNHDKKAVHLKATWGRRCNVLLFMSSVNDSSLPSVDVGIEGRNYLWGKTKRAFQYVYTNYLNATDWFLKADDDTYVIVENLRYMLSRYDPNFPIYFGSRFRKFSKRGFMSGGGGYVLSREALRIFVEVALPNGTLCKQEDTGSIEDVEMGKCLNNNGVLAGDSRDELGRGRFFPFGPGTHLNPGAIAPNTWYWDYIYYPIKNGPDCCSDTAITFHYIPPDKMYELEYLIYQLHPFGASYRDPYPLALPPDKNSIPWPLIDQINFTESGVITN